MAEGKTLLHNSPLPTDIRGSCAYCGQKTDDCKYTVRAESGLFLKKEAGTSDVLKDITNGLWDGMTAPQVTARHSLFENDMRDTCIPQRLHCAGICPRCAADQTARIHRERSGNTRAALALGLSTLAGLGAVAWVSFTVLNPLFKVIEFVRYLVFAAALMGAGKVFDRAAEHWFRARGSVEEVLLENAVSPLCGAVLAERRQAERTVPESLLYARPVSWEVRKSLGEKVAP